MIAPGKVESHGSECTPKMIVPAIAFYSGLGDLLATAAGHKGSGVQLLAGALGSALLDLVLKRRWLSQDLDSRALAITGLGRREMLKHFGLSV